MDAQRYDSLAVSELKALLAALDEFEDELEPEFTGDVLRIEFDDGEQFVVNTQRAAQQIWLAADRRAWHFDHDEAHGWVDSKGDGKLRDVLSRALSDKLGRPVSV